MGRTNTTTIDRAVPHSLDAERAVLGSVLLDNGALNVLLELVGKDDFFSESHRLILEKMLALSEKNRTIDLVTLSEELSKEGLLERVGGAAYLSALTDGVPIGSTAAVKEYCLITKEKSDARKLITITQNLTARVLEGLESAGELAESARGQLDAIGDEPEAVMHSLHDALLEVAPKVEAVERGGGELYGVPTGFPKLDALMGGWMPGQMVILAGRPSAGKTALALEFVRQRATREMASVIWSLETGRSMLAMRLVCRESGISFSRVRGGWLTKNEWRRLFEAMRTTANWSVWICDQPVVWAHDFRRRMRQYAKQHKPKLVIVDYLQLLRAKAENRVQEITRVSQEVKAAARELGEICSGTLLALCQLSRAAANEAPKLYHLRESGQLEQDADIVMFLYETADERAELGQARPWVKILDVAKQKDGPTGIVRLKFTPEVMSFNETAESAAPTQEEEQVHRDHISRPMGMIGPKRTVPNLKSEDLVNEKIRV